MNCTKCGAQLPDGAAFCTSCGAPVSPQPRQPAPQPQPQPQYQQQAPQAQHQQQAPQAQYQQAAPQQQPQPQPQPQYQQPAPQPQSKNTTLLVAFIFNIISLAGTLFATIGTGFAVVAYAWEIPMTIYLYKVYQGQKPNTTAFGVCELLFVSLVAGILLLVSKKDSNAA